MHSLFLIKKDIPLKVIQHRYSHALLLLLFLLLEQGQMLNPTCGNRCVVIMIQLSSQLCLVRSSWQPLMYKCDSSGCRLLRLFCKLSIKPHIGASQTHRTFSIMEQLIWTSGVKYIPIITVIYTSPGDGYFQFSHISLWKRSLRMELLITNKYQQNI